MVPLKVYDIKQGHDLDLWIDGSDYVAPNSSKFCMAFMVRPPAKINNVGAPSPAKKQKVAAPPPTVLKTHRIVHRLHTPQSKFGDHEYRIELPVLDPIPDISPGLFPAQCVREHMDWELDPDAMKKHNKRLPKGKLPFCLI